MFRQRLVVTAAAAVALILPMGCGDEEAAAPVAKKPATTAILDPDKDPYEVTCKDLSDLQASAELSRRATNALAVEAEIRGLTQLQASQSIFFAMTELCKKETPEFTPAKAAVSAVRAGRYRADLGTPGAASAD